MLDLLKDCTACRRVTAVALAVFVGGFLGAVVALGYFQVVSPRIPEDLAQEIAVDCVWGNSISIHSRTHVVLPRSKIWYDHGATLVTITRNGTCIPQELGVNLVKERYGPSIQFVLVAQTHDKAFALVRIQQHVNGSRVYIATVKSTEGRGRKA